MVDVFASVIFAAVLLVPQQRVDSTFWRKGDGFMALGAALGTGAVAFFDQRIANWARSSDVQGGSSRHGVVSAATVVNEVPLTIAAVTTFGIGRLTGNELLADVGAHVTEALVATEIVTEIVRSGLGRARPRESPGDPFQFKPGAGLTRFEYRSFPSLHAAVAFATAAALAEEMRVRDVRARRVVTPLLYAAATIPGFTRVYLDQHWASDILAGGVAGAFIGTRVVAYSHSHRTRVDRVLLPSVVVNRDGVVLGLALMR